MTVKFGWFLRKIWHTQKLVIGLLISNRITNFYFLIKDIKWTCHSFLFQLCGGEKYDSYNNQDNDHPKDAYIRISGTCEYGKRKLKLLISLSEIVSLP